MWRFVPGFSPGLWRVVITFHLNLVALYSWFLSWLVVVFSSWWRVVIIFHLSFVALHSWLLSWLVARCQHVPSKFCGALFLASFLVCGGLPAWRVVIIFHLNLVPFRPWHLSWLVVVFFWLAARCHRFPIKSCVVSFHSWLLCCLVACCHHFSSKSCGASFLASFLACGALSSFSI